ncbi:uncharacterized protein LOC126897473 isoform X1 [Daktulosphaira vitifoliae]|uniref:uncharacterized protein LOC126897473 isoform X1 n=1 Tax=Daktulosphaira vitifoliae TaxID=58002 RepID=UPI0021AAAA48|nr:uncharacterized protein LOC126897473 isoform X1 [Daktulosphaira vitifoliae]
MAVVNDQIFELAVEIEKRFIQFKEFKDDLTKSSNILSYSDFNMKKKFNKLSEEVSKLNKKILDMFEALNMPNPEILTKMSEYIKQYIFLKIHFDKLNKRKKILNDYTLNSGLEHEENELENKLNDVSEYFYIKLSERNNEINQEENKIKETQDFYKKKIEKMENDYKKLIEKLKREQILLQRQVNAFSQLTEV